ncbi:hypothetical protein FH802_02115 [Salmonella enterica]|uniref:hypothetical protein n=1 Tax=Salmonella enterica TaxID=28901 RepID=UPI000A1964DD|nr:hypothetical protein [Salmonella enterica]EBG1378185.1 hypothetical protein [Salmonella enterica]EBR7834840.1 hypothetical protein [Salmonella enterica]EBT1737775.1 hypothetical protein [Salmonella enterica]EBT4436067.1 hypothetical protein [Salmonella enterica]ECH4795481.1 hypothetical protein [Salmonella enterica]
MKEEITLTELSKTYGYTLNAAKKWVERGMPYNTHTRRVPKDKAVAWVLENVINPLKQTSVKEQIDLERLRRERALATAAEMDNREKMNNLIPVSYVEQELAEYCGKVKQTLLQVATIDTLEILEAATDQKTLKEKLREVITRRLNEVGDMFESAEPNESEEDETEIEITDIQEEEPEEFDLS